jgi:hypothetical protein
MNEATIADAARQIEELVKTLDHAYWEASSMKHKDLLYSMITMLNSEITEIYKLSIQDHELPYEPISKDFMDMKNKLSLLTKNMEQIVVRHQTAHELQRLIAPVSALMR